MAPTSNPGRVTATASVSDGTRETTRTPSTSSAPGATVGPGWLAIGLSTAPPGEPTGMIVILDSAVGSRIGWIRR
ncbi:hypothetical protein Xph01_12840 [Micromonospora phaseoli]|nr:hypothetical protein Xph01_12840 [Micromonospora phaseoli]